MNSVAIPGTFMALNYVGWIITRNEQAMADTYHQATTIFPDDDSL